MIDSISPDEVLSIFKSIHFPETNQKFFEVPLYCKTIRNMSPQKDTVLSRECHFAENADNQEVSDTRPLIPGLPENERLKAQIY